jgi:hypothetical protein
MPGADLVPVRREKVSDATNAAVAVLRAALRQQVSDVSRRADVTDGDKGARAEVSALIAEDVDLDGGHSQGCSCPQDAASGDEFVASGLGEKFVLTKVKPSAAATGIASTQSATS